MRSTRALPAALVITALICSSAGAKVLHDRNSQPDERTSTAKAGRTPEVSLDLSAKQYAVGSTMVLSVGENLWAKHTIHVADSSGTVWTEKASNTKSTTFTAKATKSGQITVTLTRTWDQVVAKGTVSYTVTGSTPTQPTPTPPAPTPTAPAPTPPAPTPTPPAPTTTTPTPPPPTQPAPNAAWPGQIPGKFYLGMSCGTACDTQSAALGQPYGVHRQYKTWNDWNGVAKDIQADSAAGRLPWISVKPPQGGAAGWQAISSGSYDADIRSLATTLKANDDKPVLITFHHEPSNDGTEAEGALWAAAYVHMHDVLKSEGALANVADPPIVGDWLFNPTNRTQDPANWVTDAVLSRAPFLGIDLYENASGETFADRLPRIIDWMAARGYPNKMIGIGETGSTDAAYETKSAVDWLNQSLSWVANHTDKIGVVSYFNSTANSRSGVYWPLDETAAKMTAYRTWLKHSSVID